MSCICWSIYSVLDATILGIVCCLVFWLKSLLWLLRQLEKDKTTFEESGDVSCAIILAFGMYGVAKDTSPRLERASFETRLGMFRIEKRHLLQCKLKIFGC